MKTPKKTLNSLLTSAIESEDAAPFKSQAHGIDYVRSRFFSEKSYEVKRRGLYVAAADWLQGLALNVPYMNFEIEELGYNPETYWNRLTTEFIRLITPKKPKPSDIKANGVLGKYFFDRKTLNFNGQRMVDFKTEWADKDNAIVRLYATKYLEGKQNGITEQFVDVSSIMWKKI